MIGAIVVVYNFDAEKVVNSIARLAAEVDVVCVVDNSATDSSNVFCANVKVKYIPLLENKGIAYAQNIGIEFLLDQGCTYVFFCDDDSMVEEGAISELRTNYELLREKGFCVGAVGMRAYNKITGCPYPYPCNKVAEHVVDGKVFTEVTDHMSSGTLTTSEVLGIVGNMEEELFIDAVDSEWSWRSRQKGYRYFVCESLRLNHLLGLGTKRILGRNISITPPHRMYYMYRNYLRLIRRSYVPRQWKTHNAVKYFVKAIYYPLLGDDTMAYISNIARGIKDGLKR